MSDYGFYELVFDFHQFGISQLEIEIISRGYKYL